MNFKRHAPSNKYDIGGVHRAGPGLVLGGGFLVGEGGKMGGRREILWRKHPRATPRSQIGVFEVFLRAERHVA
jgi:hypothetical protein